MLNPIAQVKQHKAVKAKDNPPTVKTVTASDTKKQADKVEQANGEQLDALCFRQE